MPARPSCSPRLGWESGWGCVDRAGRPMTPDSLCRSISRSWGWKRSPICWAMSPALPINALSAAPSTLRASCKPITSKRAAQRAHAELPLAASEQRPLGDHHLARMKLRSQALQAPFCNSGVHSLIEPCSRHGSEAARRRRHRPRLSGAPAPTGETTSATHCASSSHELTEGIRAQSNADAQ